MTYFSEETVDKIVQDVIFGKGDVFFSEYPHIELEQAEHGKVYPPNAKFWVEASTSEGEATT